MKKKYKHNYMDTGTIEDLLSRLTIAELKQLAFKFVDKDILKDKVLLKEMGVKDLLESSLIMALGLSDVVGIQLDRSKKPTRFKVIKRKGTGIGKISMF